MTGLTPTLIWAIFGMLLLMVEIFTLSFVFVFFGVAALVMAGIKAATGFDHFVTEILVFAAMGGACLFFFRERVVKAFGKKGDFANDTHKVIVLTADVPARSQAKVEYQGVAWDAYNDTDRSLVKGDKAIVTGTEGIKLIVKPHG